MRDIGETRNSLSFARNRLNALLVAQVFGFVGALVPRLADLFVSGNVVGVDALTAIAAIMPVSIGALFVGKLAYCGSGYLFALVINRVALSLWGTLLEQFVLTSACAIALYGLWSVDILWAGMPIGVLLTLAAIVLYSRFRDGKAFSEPAFEKGTAILNVSFRPAAERIVEVRNEVEAFLSAHGVSRETVGRIALLTEECSMSLTDRYGARAARIVAETSITVGREGVQVVFRDTGDRSDFTDADTPVSSLRAFVISGLIQVVRSRRYLNTIGCNRAMFAFKRTI